MSAFYQVLRWTACLFFSAFVLAGGVQLGLQWESTQPSGYAVALLKNNTTRMGPLHQNWSGDFVITDSTGNDTTFTATDLVTLSIQTPADAAAPWRLLLGILLALLVTSVVAVGAVELTRAWAPRPRRVAAPVPRRKS